MERFAELVGVLLGDGSISMYPSKKYSTFYRVKITLHEQEAEYAHYVAELLSVVLGVSPQLRFRKNERAVDVLIFKKSCVEWLVEQGLVLSPKWERAKVPNLCMSKALGKFVLRGYFDTDGSVVVTNNNGSLYPRLEMKVSPSPMQVQLVSLLTQYGFRFGVYDIGRGKVRIQLNGKNQLCKWRELIGFSNKKHQRKSLLFE